MQQVLQNPNAFLPKSKKSCNPSTSLGKSDDCSLKLGVLEPNENDFYDFSQIQSNTTIESLCKLNSQQKDVQNIEGYPFSAVGLVILNSTHFGNGFIIGPKYVMTCPYNCIRLGIQDKVIFVPTPILRSGCKFYKAKRIYFGHSFKERQGGEFKSARLKDKLCLYDFAIIELDTTDNLEQLYGSFGYDSDWAHNYQGPTLLQNVHLMGYLYTEASQLVFRHSVGNILVEESIIRHKMGQFKGVNGSPILQVIGNQYLVRGMHAGHAERGSVVSGVGLLLSQIMFDCLQDANNHLIVDYQSNSQQLIQMQGQKQLIPNMENCGKIFWLLLKAKSYPSKIYQHFERRKLNREFREVQKIGVRPSGNRAQISFLPQGRDIYRSQSRHIQNKTAEPKEWQDTQIDPQIQKMLQNLRYSRRSLQGELECYPQSTVGRLKMRFLSQRFCYYVGTASIIGPQLLITCAHNCYNFVLEKQYAQVLFEPGIWVGKQYSSYYRAKRIILPQGIDNKRQYQDEKDFAMIELDTTDNLQQIYGSLGYDTVWLENQQHPTTIYCKLIGFSGFSQLYECQGDVLIDGSIMRHKMETNPGFSGSPVIQQVNGHYFVRAVHIRGGKSQKIPHKLAVAVSGQVIKTTNRTNRLFFNFNGRKFVRDSVQDEGGFVQNIIGLPGLKYLLDYQESYKKCQFDRPVQFNLMDNNVGDIGCQLLKEAGFKDIRILNLYENNITHQGCQYLIKAQWINLNQLRLGKNQITSRGCQIIKKGNWPALTLLHLRQNKIQPQGCRYLSEAKWEKLQQLGLGGNPIKDQGCMYLSQANWPRMLQIYLWDCRIGDQGCLYLSKANWKKLQGIYLLNFFVKPDSCNKISKKGGQYLSQARWPQLLNFIPRFNQLEAEGCEALSRASWPKLSVLNLRGNRIKDQGCIYLAKAGFTGLSQLYLGQNLITVKGCQYLKHARWNNLTKLSLANNQIEDEGCYQLAQADWPKMQQICLFGNKISIGLVILQRRGWKAI